MLTCILCDKPIGDCVCNGKDAELKHCAMDPAGHVAFKWCRKCDKHYARCRCVQPEFYVLFRGQDFSDRPFYDVLGRKTEPDLQQR